MSPPKTRPQYTTLTYAEKLAVIREVDKGVKKKSQIAKEFGIPANTLSTYIKNRDKILSCVRKRNGASRKRAREPENPDIEKFVLKWFKEAQNEKIAITGALIRAKAEEFASSLGKSDFKASCGWLSCFKERNGIYLKTVTNESKEVKKVKKPRKYLGICETDEEFSTKVTFKKEKKSPNEVKKLDKLSKKPIPVSEAQFHLREVRRFVQEQNDVTISIFQALNVIQEFMVLRARNPVKLIVPDLYKKINT